MTLLQRIVAGGLSLAVMILIVDLVKRRKLREEYSVLWLGAGCVMLLAVVVSGALDWFARLLQIKHVAYAVFVLALFVGLVLAIHFTVVLSKLTAQTWRLTQEVGLLKARLEAIEAEKKNAELDA